MEINIIVAADQNQIIGKDGTLAGWNLAGDRKFFKDLTVGHAVGAGRKTFESYPDNYRPLPDRENYILTRNELYIPSLTNDKTFVCGNIMNALNLAAERGIKKFFCGGGAQFYEQLWGLGLVDSIYYTHIHGSFEGDTYFPSSIKLGKITRQEILLEQCADSKNSHAFTIIKYSRR